MNPISTPTPASRTECPLLVVFADLTRFMLDARRVEPHRLADLIDHYYERVADAVAGAGGHLLKFMGDGALAVFAEPHVDAAVLALLQLKQDVDAWLHGLGWDSRLYVRAHFGPVIAGPYGGQGAKRFDVIGETVNVAARLDARGFALSAQAFRKLSPALRRRFKKHTPPILYIPLEHRRPA
ncbi:MAG TPA: adenylate/guanylate cyclase domain-containing protein [Polyangia bacterium]|nr:adenylate/guanylate cyclase domain-containing protein [Polyangia bacterium]